MFDRQTNKDIIKSEIQPTDSIKPMVAPSIPSLWNVPVERPSQDFTNLANRSTIASVSSLFATNYNRGVMQKCIILPKCYMLHPYKEFPDKYIQFKGLSLGLDYKGEYMYSGTPCDVWFPLHSFFLMFKRAQIRLSYYAEYPVMMHFKKVNKQNYELYFCGILNEVEINSKEYNCERILYRKEGYKFQK